MLSQLAARKTVAHAAAAVYHEVAVDISASTSSENEPLEDPPTRIKATGRVIASEWLARGGWPGGGACEGRGRPCVHATCIDTPLLRPCVRACLWRALRGVSSGSSRN